MSETELTALLDRLRREPHESEWLEFKENRYDPQMLGEYLSALANSACIHRKEKGYLVFGIENRTHAVKGTSFNPEKAKGKGNQALQLWLATGLKPNVGYEVHRFVYQEHSIVIFTVNPAFDRPVMFFNTAYVRVGSSKTTLSNHPEKEREIWNRRKQRDWSAQICEKATLADLSPEAISKARAEYKAKFPQKAEEVDSWDDTQFLNKTKLTIQGKMTNTAILLLGRAESATLISPAVTKISWILKNERNQEKDYEHFGPPFLLNVDLIFARVRNLTYRHMPGGTLFPIEISQYDRWVIREALHNCIAHQDYTLCGRINLVETPSALILSNMGNFLPGNVETVIRQDAPSEVYRNPFLADAMVNLNMIDTQGGGIKKMFHIQMQRFFPLPDYDLSDSGRVKVTIRGEILDEKYTRMLMEKTDLDLWTVILLDKVQKRTTISREEHKRLKALGTVEGRYPNIFISSTIAAATGGKAEHIRYKGLDNQYYRDILVELIREHGPVARQDIDRLLMDKLPEIMTDKQKKDKIHNVISELTQHGAIKNIGSRRYSKWILIKKQSHGIK